MSGGMQIRCAGITRSIARAGRGVGFGVRGDIMAVRFTHR